MQIIANEVRIGNLIEHKNGLWEVLKIMHTQPGKGGAYIQVEMKEIIKNIKLNERFRSGQSIAKAVLEEEDYQYLYTEGEFLILMDPETYEQESINKLLLGKNLIYLQDRMVITLLSYNDKTIKAKVPKYVTLCVVEAEAVVKGQTASSSYKPITLENGIKIMAPSFITAGNMVIVRTEDNSYYERKKK